MHDDTVPVDGSGVMFDAIAPRYDLLNRLLSLGVDRGWRRRAVQRLVLVDDGRYLDLACGTGDVALSVLQRHPRARVLGVDPSHGMLQIASSKRARQAEPGALHLARGVGEQLPLASACVDGAVMAFGIRNAVDRLAVLRELGRVVRPGGRVVVLELGEPRGPSGALFRAYFHTLAPLVGRLLSRGAAYSYLTRSVAAFPEPEVFAGLMTQAGLRVVEVQRLTLGAAHLYTAQVS